MKFNCNFLLPIFVLCFACQLISDLLKVADQIEVMMRDIMLLEYFRHNQS